MTRFDYECSCGESWDSLGGAIGCRKCLKYAVTGYCAEVRYKGDIVWSMKPSKAVTPKELAILKWGYKALKAEGRI